MAKQSCAFVVVNGQTVGIPEELRQELEKNRIPEQAMASVVRMVAPPTTSQSDVSFSAWLGNTLSSGATRLELYAGDDGFISAKAVIDYLKFFKAKVAAKTNIYFPDSNNTYSAEFSRKVLDSIGANLIIGMLNAEISPYELIEDQSKYPKLFSDSLATALDDLRYAKEYYESIGKTASLEYDQITKFISDAYNNPFVVDAFFKTHLDKKGIRSKQLGNLVFVTDDQLTDIETTKEIQEDSEDASTKKDGLSGLDSFERDKLNNAPFAVELLFSLMPSQVGKDETGNLVSYRDELYGLRVGGNVAKLKAFVAENLANKPANGDILMYELEKHLTEQKDSDDQWASIVLDFLNMPYNNEQQRLDRVKLLQEFTQFATNHDQAFSTDIMAADGSISRISDTIDNNVHRFIRSTRTAREVFRTSRSLSSHEHQAELIKLSSKVSSGMANDEDYLELLKSLGYVKLDFNDTSVLYKSYAEATKNLPQANNLKEFLENTAQYINRGLSKDFNIARPDNLKSSKAITDLITKYKSEIYKKSKVLGSIFIPETFKAIKHHLTPERKQKHNINRKSFLTDYSDYLIYIAKELVEDEAFNTKAEAREALIDFLPELADPILNTSVILDSVLEAMVNKDFEKYGFTVDSLSGVMDRTESIGVGTDFDHLNEQLVLQSYVKSIEENSLHLPRTADRGMEYFVRLHPGTQFELGKDDTSTEAHLEKVVIDFVVALQEANKAGTDYSKYSWGDKAKTNLRFFEFLVSQEERNALGLKGAAPFKLADFLTAGVKETTSGLTFTNAALASKVRSAISEFIQNEQTKFLDYAFALGVGKPKRNSTAVAGIPLEYYNAFRKTEFDPKTATALVLKRVANGMIISFLETSRFFAGDPIAFKDSDEFFKRLALLNATKKSSTTSKELKTFLVETVPNSRHARLNKNKPTQEYINRLNDDSLTTLVLENEFSNLEQRDFETYVGLEEAIKDALNSLGVSSEQAVRQTLANTIEKYKNAESADAMGYITLDSYRRLQLKEGSWNNEKEALYKRLVRGVEVSTAEVLNKFSVLKPQGYGKVGQELNKNISTARKLALFPLIPQVLEPGSKLAILEEYMSREGIDIATYPSGIKFGYSKPVNLNNLEEGGKDAVDVTSYNDFGVQVDIYAKEEDLTAESVQKAKNIYANSYAAGVPVNESKVDLLEKYTELRNLLVQRRLKDFLTEVIKMNEESVGTFDLSRIAEDLIKTATELQYSPAELEFMSLSLNKGYIDFDSSSSMVENMVVSSFRNKVIRNKRPGYSSPQVSNVGFKKESSNLRFYRKSKISEELLPMEFITTIPSSIEQWAKKEFSDNYLNILNRKIAKENKLFNEYHEGKISEEEYTLKSDKLIDNLVKVIGFRIPNQGPNSSEYMRVVEFLPSIYDGVAMAAMEIVVKTGSDFDIDKLNLYFPTIDKGGSIQRIDFLSQAQKIAAKEIKELFTLTDSVEVNVFKQELLDFIIEENNKKTDASSSMIDTIVYKTINNASSEELAAMLSNDSTVVVATEEDKMILPDEVSLSKEIRYFINGYKAKRKLDRVVELLMDNKVLLNRIGQDAIENELFFTEYEAMQPTSAQDIADFLLPLGTDTIKKVVNKIRKAKGISTSTGTGYGLNISPANNLKKFSSFLSSGAGIGIAAIHLANHPMGQRADLKVFDYGFNLIGKGAKFSENNMVSFGQIYDVDNSSIINNVSEILNAFLDIVKDDFPIDANLTEKSASIAIMMIRSGMSPNDVLTFMSQPIVVEYFKTLSNISKGRSRVPAYFVLERMFSERGKSLDNMKNMHNLVVTKKDYEKLHERIGQAKSIAEAGYLVRLSTSELDAGLSTPLADILTDKTQINVLKQFLILEKTAGAFGGWVSTQAPDSKGFKDTAQLENQNIIENYFEGSIIMSVDRSVKLPTSAHKQAKQIITPILKSTKLSSFYDPTGELDLLKDAVRKDFDLSKDEKDKRINEIDRLFVKFVTTVKLKDANIIDLSYKSKDYNRLTTGVASVPNRLLKLKKVLDSYGISNGFLDRAIFNLGEGNGGADIISLDIVNSDRYAVRSIVDGLQTFSDNRAYYQGLVKSSGYEFSVGALFEDLVYYSFLISDPLDPSTQISRFIPAADRFNLIYDYIDPNLASTLDYSDYGKTFVTLLTKEVDKFSGLKTNKNYYLTGTHGLVLPAASTLSKEKTKVITEANIKKAEEIRKTCMGL